MKIFYSRAYNKVFVGYLLGLLAWAQPALAQESCLLAPVPLAQRLAQARWVVEARADAPQVVRDAQNHLLTRYGLTVFKVFRGPKAGAALPAALLLEGGTLGDRREEVSNTPHLVPGQQGVFFLEPDPQHPDELRLFAGPQGMIRYDLTDHTAAEPFAAYPTIETALYLALRDPVLPRGYRPVQANAALAAPVLGRRPSATAAITGFSPASIMAGTGALLTITGSNFGVTQGTGTVQFLNADNGGTSRVHPLDADYVSWTDTQIQVRVPSTTQEGSPTGTGPVTVENAAGVVSTSSTPLTIRYGIINLKNGTPAVPLRPKLIDANGTGGYTLTYANSFQLNTFAQAAFERSTAQWTCKTGANRVTTAPAATTPTTHTFDGVNIVAFDATPATLPTGVLGVTYSYYRLCVANVTLPETDFVFANRSDWNFGDHALAANEYDFESVTLHELGHGIQLAHVINTAAVMHFSISNGQGRRTLGTNDDLPGGRDEVQFSTTPNSVACGIPPAPHVLLATASCSPLPVELASFDARYEGGRGTRLQWATASEYASAYFAVETQEEGGAGWAEVLRQPAAGTSSAPRSYDARDPRLLSGTRYYRLREVDLDGQRSYSPVVAVSGAETSLAFYPNPVADRLQVSGPAHPGRLMVYDLAGREVTRFALVSGPNVVDVSSLRPGLYQVEWTDGQTVRRGCVQKL